jgi:hypothetical protein
MSTVNGRPLWETESLPYPPMASMLQSEKRSDVAVAPSLICGEFANNEPNKVES